MSLRPLGYQVLVEVEKIVEKRPDSSIIIPSERLDREQEAHSRATVLGIGGGAFSKGSAGFDPNPPKIGGKVLIASYTGIKETVDGKIVKLLRDEEILAVEED